MTKPTKYITKDTWFYTYTYTPQNSIEDIKTYVIYQLTGLRLTATFYKTFGYKVSLQ